MLRVLTVEKLSWTANRQSVGPSAPSVRSFGRGEKGGGSGGGEGEGIRDGHCAYERVLSYSHGDMSRVRPLNLGLCFFPSKVVISAVCRPIWLKFDSHLT